MEEKIIELIIKFSIILILTGSLILTLVGLQTIYKLIKRAMSKEKEIICPKCGNGTLELLDAEDHAKIKQNPKQKVYGCDECHYWQEERFLKSDGVIK